MSQPFLLKNVKITLTRSLNLLSDLIAEANDFREWEIPNTISELELFIPSNRLRLQNLISVIAERRQSICEYYANCTCTVASLSQEEKSNLEQEFDAYWLEKKGEDPLLEAEHVERQLEKRLVELECNNTLYQQELRKRANGGIPNSADQSVTAPTVADLSHRLEPTNTSSGFTLERRLLGNELKIPEFNGTPTEFGPFWELFEELVHKQPYSNIEKLSILLSCCKGDAARTLQMIPRAGESYDKAVTQLKSQYEDPRQITMQMIRKLKSMKQCREDSRSLRNNLSDVQAITATLEKQGEVVNTTYMISMILDTFPQNIQDEMAKKEFDSGKSWTMADLLDNLTLLVKRKEHISSIKNSNNDEHLIFHTSAMTIDPTSCIGCGQPHKFRFCNKYVTANQKIERLKTLKACWKCFTRNHTTQFCRKRNCIYCGGHHNPILCNKQPRRAIQWSRNDHRQEHHSPSNKRRNHIPIRHLRNRSYSPRNGFRAQLHSYSQPYNGPRNSSSSRNGRFFSRSNSRSPPREWHNKFIGRRFARSLSRSPDDQHRVRFASSPIPRQKSPRSVRVNFQSQKTNYTEANDKSNTNPFINNGEVRLMIVPVQLQDNMDMDINPVYALLDSASDQSFILNSLAKRLNLSIQKETTIIVNTFGGRAERKRVKRVISNLYNSSGNYITVQLLTHDKITPPLHLGDISPQDRAFIQDNFSSSEARCIIDAATGTITPEILIGMDYFNSVISLHQSVIRLPSGLFMTPTFFGPVISGVTTHDNDNTEQRCFYEHIVQTCTSTHPYDNDFHFDISDLWKLPGIGIEECCTEEELNQQIVENFYSTVENRNGQIYVRFPWKPNKDCLANNYNLALSRLHQLFKMKERNPECWKDYCNIIEEQLKKNFIEAPFGMNTESIQDDVNEDPQTNIRKKLTQIQCRTVDIPVIKTKVESTYKPKENLQKDQKRKRKYTSPSHSAEITQDRSRVKGTVNSTAQNVVAVKNLVEDMTEDLDHVQSAHYNLEELVKKMDERIMNRFDHMMDFQMEFAQKLDYLKQGHDDLVRQIDNIRQQQPVHVGPSAQQPSSSKAKACLFVLDHITLGIVLK